MTQAARDAVLGWMNGLGIRDPSNLSLEDYAQVRTVMSATERRGFGVFLSLVFFERQQAVAQLLNCDLSNSNGAIRAAKLQGTIGAIDNVRELLLNIADPIGEDSSAPRKQEQGVVSHG